MGLAGVGRPILDSSLGYDGAYLWAFRSIPQSRPRVTVTNVKIQFVPTPSRAWRCLLPLILLTFTVGCRVGHSPDKATFSGGRAANGGFAISSPNLFIREGAPGVVFGTYGVPNMPDALSYFVLFKHPPGGLAQPGFAPRTSARDEADGLSASLNLDIGGARLGIAHRIALNEPRTGIAKETLSIEGKALDVSAGRFFYTLRGHRLRFWESLKV